MTEPAWNEIRDVKGSFRLKHPLNWRRQDNDDGTVSLIPEKGEVAITLSVARHRDPLHRANASSQLIRFLQNLELESRIILTSSPSLSLAECVEVGGIRWQVLAVSKGNAITIVSLNASLHTDADQDTWREGVAILKTVA